MDCKPFVKWVGGKTQLLDDIDSISKTGLLADDLTYIESFVGGGAVLFWVLNAYPEIKAAVINDVNKDLISVYRVIKETPELLINELEKIQNDFNLLSNNDDRESFYYAKRDRFNTKILEDLENATLFIFLNKTCFNGLYRVNSKGLFNVPFGKYEKISLFDRDTILNDSKLLKKVIILNGDFEETIKYIDTKNAFFYFDPPYRPINKTSSFTSYSNNGFNDDEQIRLKKYCDLLVNKGYNFVLSNSDPKNTDQTDNFFDDLYKDYKINRVQAARFINSVGVKRGSISELLITNI